MENETQQVVSRDVAILNRRLPFLVSTEMAKEQGPFVAVMFLGSMFQNEYDILGKSFVTSSSVNNVIGCLEPFLTSMRCTGERIPAVFLSFVAKCVTLAITENSKRIWLGLHKKDDIGDDAAVFLENYQKTIDAMGFKDMPRLHAPFLGKPLAAVVEEGLRLKAPLHLARSCHRLDKSDLSCGVCHDCNAHREAFAACGAPDPVPYTKVVYS